MNLVKKKSNLNTL